MKFYTYNKTQNKNQIESNSYKADKMIYRLKLLENKICRVNKIDKKRREIENFKEDRMLYIVCRLRFKGARICVMNLEEKNKICKEK